MSPRTWGRHWWEGGTTTTGRREGLATDGGKERRPHSRRRKQGGGDVTHSHPSPQSPLGITRATLVSPNPRPKDLDLDPRGLDRQLGREGAGVETAPATAGIEGWRGGHSPEDEGRMDTDPSHPFVVTTSPRSPLTMLGRPQRAVWGTSPRSRPMGPEPRPSGGRGRRWPPPSHTRWGGTRWREEKGGEGRWVAATADGDSGSGLQELRQWST